MDVPGINADDACLETFMRQDLGNRQEIEEKI
jgi:hypothetical protein